MRNKDMETITYNVVTKVQETEEEFIFQTISPFCNNVANKIVRKKELQEMLVRARRMKWIPCSERLPAVDGMYTTTLSGELVGTNEPFVGQVYFKDGYWEEDEDCVIAWMPLPEPYREVTDEENLESRR